MTITDDTPAKKLLAAGKAKREATQAAKRADADKKLPKLRKLTISLRTQKARPWVVRGFALRGAVTLVVGSGGASKTQLLIQSSMMWALGQPFAAFVPMGQLRIMLVSGEEDNDELDRRLEAAAHWYITTRLKEPFNDKTVAALMETLDGFLWTYEPGEEALDVGPLVVMGDKETPEQTAFCQQMKRDVVACRADVVIFDPLINFHSGLKESNAEHMQHLNVAGRQIGRAGKCAVILAHHATKALGKNAEDPNAARGSGALHAGARVQKGMTEMSAEEGKEYFSNPDAHLDYVVLSDPKQNYSKKSRPIVLRRVPIPLHTLQPDNSTDFGYALEVADLRTLAEDVLGADWLPKFIAAIDEAYRSPDPHKTAYSTAVSGKSDRKARDLLVNSGWATKAHADEILDKLTQAGRIAEVEVEDGKGHSKKVYRAVPQDHI